MTNINNVQDLGTILNGMSTALSTTMTGIVAYILFRFYLSKLLDVQNNIFYAVERVTTMTLMPEFSVTEDSIVPKLHGLLEGMEKMVEKMVQHHNFMIETNHKLTDSMDRYNENIGGMVHGINEINENLNRGFRL